MLYCVKPMFLERRLRSVCLSRTCHRAFACMLCCFLNKTALSPRRRAHFASNWLLNNETSPIGDFRTGLPPGICIPAAWPKRAPSSHVAHAANINDANSAWNVSKSLLQYALIEMATHYVHSGLACLALARTLHSVLCIAILHYKRAGIQPATASGRSGYRFVPLKRAPSFTAYVVRCATKPVGWQACLKNEDL